MRRGRSGRHGPARLSAAVAALLLLHYVHGDVIFRVPEVLVRHAAASKPVGTGRANATKLVAANDSDQWNPEDSVIELRYEEYYVEHDVSTGDARRAAKELNLDDVAVSPVGCGSCSAREMQYCESRVLADHCCCERRFVREPFPWLPHTCYLGPSRCRPLARDCAHYARLRDCCCRRRLAERWKSILSNSTRLGVGGVSLLLLSMLLFVAYL